jgi:hypothetical protein
MGELTRVARSLSAPDLVHWLEAQPITWSEFSRQLAENRSRQKEAEAKRWEQVGGYVPWETLDQWVPGPLVWSV